jgi:hypothetical protein
LHGLIHRHIPEKNSLKKIIDFDYGYRLGEKFYYLIEESSSGSAGKHGHTSG